MSIAELIFPVEVPPLDENTTATPPVEFALPAASRVVRVNVIFCPDATVAAETEIVEVAAEGAPGTTVIVGSVVVIGVAAIAADMIVALPDTAPVNTDEYVPLPLSATAENDPVLVPPMLLIVTVEPPTRIELLKLSLACKVTDVVEPEATLELPTVSVDVAVEIAPGLTVICGCVLVMAEPPIVPLILVAEPEVVPENVEV